MRRIDKDPVLESWPTVDSEQVGDFSIFSVHRCTRRSPTNGIAHQFLQVQAPDWVNVIALTTSGGLLLVEQFRHGTERLTLEIPGGTIDPGEAPAEAAARELVEETGHACASLHQIGVVEPNSAFLSNSCWTFLALGCERVSELHLDPAEEIGLRLADLEAFTRLIDDGTIRHALVVAAHDHLKRGIRRQAPWAQQLPGRAD